MNEEQNKEAIEALTKKSFQGKKYICSKYTPKLPEGLEREYERITRQYMGLFKHCLEEELPKLKKQMSVEYGSFHKDDNTSMQKILRKILDEVKIKFNAKEKKFELRKKLEALSLMTRKLTTEEWKKTVRKTLGIDILDDYYFGEFYKENLKKWVDENVGLIVTIPSNTLDEMKKVIETGFLGGSSVPKIMRDIQNRYNVNKNRAKFIARDQIGKLNSSIAKAQQQDAGIEKYEWVTCGDSRVRETHKALNGNVYRWDNPPIVDKKTRRRCHPQEDFQCRCRAKPVFEIGVFKAPISRK